MEESILQSIRKMIGGMAIPEGETGPFDLDLIFHINSVLQILNQLGVGKEDFQIVDDEQVWSQFLGRKFKNLNMVKSYVALRVRMLFDPPSSATLLQAMKENAAELEWRLNTKVDRGLEREDDERNIKEQWLNQYYKGGLLILKTPTE